MSIGANKSVVYYESRKRELKIRCDERLTLALITFLKPAFKQHF
jgi:hypothetical protein